MHTRALLLSLAAIGLSGCAGISSTSEAPRGRAYVLNAHDISLTYAPGIDRVTAFGPIGTNLLHTANLDQAPDPNGDYTFYGGMYSWTAPQNGQGAWIDAQGEPKAWPPDVAMDTGPATVSSRSRAHIAASNPPALTGLVQHKRFEILPDASVIVTFALENVSEASVAAAAWINTAVASDSLIAVRRERGTPIRGWNDETIARFNSICTSPDANGWVLVRIPDAMWEGGGKIWLDTTPDIAVWRDGYWLLRRQPSVDTANRLRDIGEGPVAIYIQPDAGIIEAELYAPVTDIRSGDTRTDVEVWSVIADPVGTTAALP